MESREKQFRNEVIATSAKKQKRGAKPSQTQKKPSPRRGERTPNVPPGRVPTGRTLKTKDNYLANSRTDSKKNRTVVVIENDGRDNLAVVPLSSRPGSHRTQMKNYQQGKSYFKHFVEIEDDSGRPIRVNEKFRANHKNQDVSEKDIEKIKNKVFFHSKPSLDNRNKIERFRKRKNPQDKS